MIIHIIELILSEIFWIFQFFEVMNAVHFVVEQQISIPLDDLKKMASQLLGFARRGANVDMQVMKAINLLIGRGILVDNNGNMMLK